MKKNFWRIAFLIAIPLLLVAVLVGCKALHTRVEKSLVLQLDNRFAISNATKTAITDTNGDTVVPYVQDGQLMVPLQWIANELEWTIQWDQATQNITIVDDTSAEASIAIDKAQLTIDDETVSLGVAPALLNGTTYIPLRDVVQNFGYQLYFVEEEQGGFIFLDNKKTSEAPTAEEIASASTILGPSQVQIMQKAIILRAGSDHVMLYGNDTALSEDKKAVAPFREEEDIYTWLPAKVCAALLDAQVTQADDGTLTITDSQGTQSVLGVIEATQTDDSAQVKAVRMVDDVAYVSAEAFAEAMHLQQVEPVSGVVVLCSDDITAYTDQLLYTTEVAQTLPDKLDIPIAKYYVALTFDDGPTGGADGRTVHLLNGLEERGAHATFFMCGYRIKDFHTHMDRYLAGGHEVGNHTMDHPGILTKYSAEEVYNQFQSNNELIASYVGENPTVGRPVGGSYNDMVLEQMKRAGLPAINWSVDTMDWKYRDAEHVKNAIINNVKDGDIVLMHDLYQTTIDGVLAAIDALKDQGYAFVTVQELATVKGVTLEPGKLYTGFR